MNSEPDEIDEILDIIEITTDGEDCWVDGKIEAKQQLLALKKKWQDEARIDELKRIEIGGDNIWTVDKGTDTAMLISELINQLNGDK